MNKKKGVGKRERGKTYPIHHPRAVSRSNLLGSVFVRDDGRQGFSFGKAGESDDGNSVGGKDLVVVGRVVEGQRQHALLLQVGLVDTGEALDDDGAPAEVTRFQRRVLAGRSFAVVFRTDHHPRNTAWQGVRRRKCVEDRVNGREGEGGDNEREEGRKGGRERDRGRNKGRERR